jgi:hypothetical protein
MTELDHHCPICQTVLYQGEQFEKMEHFKFNHSEIYEFLFERDKYLITIPII